MYVLLALKSGCETLFYNFEPLQQLKTMLSDALLSSYHLNPTAKAITLLLVLIKRCLVSGRKEYQCNCVVLPALLSEFHECCFFKDKAIHRCANILQQS